MNGRFCVEIEGCKIGWKWVFLLSIVNYQRLKFEGRLEEGCVFDYLCFF